MNDRDIGYVIDIILACRDVMSFTKDRIEKDLEIDGMFQAAILRKLEIIGEVAKRVSNEFKESNSEIKWKKWAGFRDRLIHGYDDVDLEIVWSVVQDEVPELHKILEKYYQE